MIFSFSVVAVVRTSGVWYGGQPDQRQTVLENASRANEINHANKGMYLENTNQPTEKPRHAGGWGNSNLLLQFVKVHCTRRTYIPPVRLMGMQLEHPRMV